MITSRKWIKPYNIISLDLRKAFDSVLHSSIKRSLTRFGVQPLVSDYIMNSYDNVSTTISCSSNITSKIPIGKGVTQGDPISPMLFNMVIDEILDTIVISMRA